MAWHLGHQLKNAGHTIAQVYNRGTERGEELAAELDTEFTNKFDGITRAADIYLLAVSDHGIDDIILGLKLEGKIVAHTSGSVPLKGMEHISANNGIFYPLQTLTRRKEVSFKDVPVFLEASNDGVKQALTVLAESIGCKVYMMGSNKRRAVHVAAVFANNFTNYLFGISKQILDKEEIPFDVLLPLIQETVNKVKENNPADIQTGPARRGDYKTIEEHLHYLQRNDDQRETYLVLTESILSKYREKPQLSELEQEMLDAELGNDYGDFDDLDSFDDDGHGH